MDSLKKIEEISQQNEALFDKIFGHAAPKVRTLAKNNQGNYFINGNFVYTFATDGTANPYIEDTWYEPDMKWILEPDVKFRASYIVIKKRKIEFQGTWNNGTFKGANFSGERSYFEEDGIFQGEVYSAPNENFKAIEDNFISGKWVDYKNGILGKTNYTSEQENVSDIALISVPVGWTVVISGDGNKKINLKVLKKIDNISTDFQFQVLEDLKKYTVDWETIRSNYLQNGFVIKGRTFRLLGRPEYEISDVESVSLVSESPAVKAQNVNVLDFSKDSNLSGILPGKVQIVLSDVNDINRAKEFQRKIDNGVLEKTITILKDLIQKRELDGYVDDNLYYLKPVFNNNKGSQAKINIILKNQNVMNMMRELNDLLELISFNSQVIKEADGGVYNALVKNMKKALDVNKFIAPVVPRAQKAINVIDFSKDKNLAKYFSLKGVPIKFQVSVKTPEIKQKVADLQKSISDGSLYSSLLQLKYFIQNGSITGYSDDNWKYLKTLFNNQKGKFIFDPDVQKIMAGLNDLVWLLAFNSNVLKEAENQTFKWIINILKKILEINKYMAKTSQEEPQGEPTTSEPDEKEKIAQTVATIKKAAK